MKYYFGLALFLFGLSLSAQNLKVGLSAGLIRSSFDSNDMEEGESYGYTNGFSFGVTAEYAISDVFGLRSGINLYQKGAKHDFIGGSYWHITNPLTSREFVFPGPREQKLVVSNTYVALPIGIYGTIRDRVQIYGTLDFGYLVSSSGSGQMDFVYEGQVYSSSLNYRYKRDKAGEGSGDYTSIAGTDFGLPAQSGAYFEYSEKESNLYNSFDISANVGLNVYLTSSLYVGARYNYGLMDITSEKSDRSYVKSTNGGLSFRDDKDRNVGYEFMVGFNF